MVSKLLGTFGFALLLSLFGWSSVQAGSGAQAYAISDQNYLYRIDLATGHYDSLANLGPGQAMVARWNGGTVLGQNLDGFVYANASWSGLVGGQGPQNQLDNYWSGNFGGSVYQDMVSMDGGSVIYRTSLDGSGFSQMENWSANSPYTQANPYDFGGENDMSFEDIAVTYWNVFVRGTKAGATIIRKRSVALAYSPMTTLFSSTTQPLVGLALNVAQDTLYSFDSNSNLFVKMDTLGSAPVNTLLSSTSVQKIRIGSDGAIYWINDIGLWKSTDYVHAVQVGPNLSFLHFSLDLENQRDTIIADFPNPIFLPLGQGKQVTFNKATLDIDGLACRVDTLGNARFSALPQGYDENSCSYLFVQNIGTPFVGEQDSARLILSDLRGSLDTTIVRVIYRADQAPAMILPPPSPYPIVAYADNRIPIPLTVDAQDSVSFRLWNAHYPITFTPPSATTCSPTTAAWMGTSFFVPSGETTSGGVLKSIDAGFGYEGPMLMKIYYGDLTNFNPDTTTMVFQQFVPGFGATQGVSHYDIRGDHYLPWGPYTMVAVPLNADQLGFFCTVDAGQGPVNFSGYGISSNLDVESSVLLVDSISLNTGFSVEKVRGDTAHLLLIPDGNSYGSDMPLLLEFDDGHRVTRQTLTVNAGEAVIPVPAFVPGPSVRVAKRNRSSDSATIVPNWFSESTALPRQYTLSPLSADAPLFDYMRNPLLPVGTSLQVSPAIGQAGVGRFQIQRCFPSQEVCDIWDTVSVYISTPPEATLNSQVDTIQATKSSSVGLTLSDIDAGDLALSSISLLAETPVASHASMVPAGFHGASAVLQTFQLGQDALLSAIDVYGSFNQSTIRVAIYPSTSLAMLDEMGGYSIIQGYQTPLDSFTLNVTAGDTGWHRLEFPQPLNLKQNQPYAWVLGIPNLMVDQVSLAYAGPGFYPGRAFLAQSMSFQLQAQTEDYLHRLQLVKTVPSWASVSKQTNSAWTLQMSPALVDTGNVHLLIKAFDGVASSYSRFSTVIARPHPIALYTKGADLARPTTPEDHLLQIKYWANVASLPAVATFETQRLQTLVDSSFFATSLPTILTSDGSLHWTQPANSVGSGRFLLRACNAWSECSSWDTVRVSLKPPPTLTMPVLDSMPAGGDSTVAISMSLANFTISQRSLGLVASQATHNVLVSASQMGQAVRLPAAGAIGELKVFARFPLSRARVVVKDSSDLAGLPLIDVYVPVAPDTLMWQSLALPPEVALLGSHSYQIQVSSLNNTIVAWGMDSTNAYAGGTASVPMILGLDESRYDMAFEVWTRFAAPAFSSLAPVSGYSSTWHLTPLAVDTGSYRMLFALDDGTTSTAVVTQLKILAPLSSSSVAPSSSSIEVSSSSVAPSSSSIELSSSSLEVSSSSVLPSSSSEAPSSSSIEISSSSLPLSSSSETPSSSSIEVSSSSSSLEVSSSSVLPSSSSEAPYSSSSAMQSSSSATIVMTKLAVRSEGQAVLLTGSGILDVNITSNTLDTMIQLYQGSRLWLPAPQGTYTATWFNGKNSESLEFEVGTESSIALAPGKWYLTGFGHTASSFAPFESMTQVFHWDDQASSTTYSRYLDRENLGQALPGRGYWVMAEVVDSIGLSPIRVAPSVLHVPVAKGATGWNMVSNPWSWPIHLPTGQDFWMWDKASGGYIPATFIPPFQGGWVNVESSGTLALDPAPAFDVDSSSLSKVGAPLFASLNDFRVQVKVSGIGSSDAWNYLGVTAGALEGADRFDGAEPPASPTGGLALSLGGIAHPLSRDMRPALKGASWPVRISSAQEGRAQLTFVGADRIQAAGYNLVLVLNGNAQNISDQKSIQVSLQRGSVDGVIRAVPVGQSTPLVGGLSGLQIASRKGWLALEYTVPQALSGLDAQIELVGLDGKVIAHQISPNVSSGVNHLELSTQGRGLALVRVRVGRSQVTALALRE